MSILIFAETENGKFKQDAFEIASYAFNYARTKDTIVTAICFNANDPHQLSNYGVKKIINSNQSELKKFDPNVYSECIAKVFNNEESQSLILSSSSNSKHIAGKLAIILEAGYVSNVISAPKSKSNLLIKRNTFTNKAFELVEILKQKSILSLSKNSFGLFENKMDSQIDDYKFSNLEFKNKIESVEKVDNIITIADADIVVSGGRGLKGPENWHLIEDLAEVLGAATACSKPVSDLGWRPHSEHVGQTGKPVSSNLYIAIGISGAIQHLAGVNSSKTKVVINTDPDAPFFKAADYGIVGDAFEVVPKLIEKIKDFKSSNC